MKRLLFLGAIALHLNAEAQLSVGAAESLNVPTGAVLSMDGVSLSPSANLTISDNVISKTATPEPIAGSSSINRVYNFNSALSSYTGVITIFYSDDELNGNTESLLKLAYQNTGTWLVNTATIDATNNYVTYNTGGAISFQSLTLTSGSVVLPITEKSLKAVWVQNKINVHWTIEQNNLYKEFIVEANADSRGWKNIGTVAAQTAAGKTDYSFIDDKIDFATKLYRIKLNSHAGSGTYSYIVAIKNSGQNIITVLSKKAAATIIFKQAQPDEVNVYNTNGQVVWQSKVQQSIYTIGNLKAGVYVMRYAIGTSWLSQSFIIAE